MLIHTTMTNTDSHFPGISIELTVFDPSWPTVGIGIDYAFLSGPLGTCLAAEADGKLCYLAFSGMADDLQQLDDLAVRWPGAVLSERPRLPHYREEQIFANQGVNRVLLKLLLRGTAFQVQVWQMLLSIPPGEVWSYSELAKGIGRSTATRAVGSALGANPIAWLIPCHRVVRSDGGLGGYRWGLSMKQACLDYERARVRKLNGATSDNSTCLPG